MKTESRMQIQKLAVRYCNAAAGNECDSVGNKSDFSSTIEHDNYAKLRPFPLLRMRIIHTHHTGSSEATFSDLSLSVAHEVASSLHLPNGLNCFRQMGIKQSLRVLDKGAGLARYPFKSRNIDINMLQCQETWQEFRVESVHPQIISIFWGFCWQVAQAA